MKRNLNLVSLTNNEQETINAGVAAEPCCVCACYYANSGGSSTTDNGRANAKGCLISVIPIEGIEVRAD